MLIVVTGSPGTGKSTSSKILGKLIGAEVIHLREFAAERKLASGRDKKTESDLVDVAALGRELRKEVAKLDCNEVAAISAYRGEMSSKDDTKSSNRRRQRTRNGKLVVEGHLACEIRLPADYAFVLRCKPGEMEKRLRARKYGKEKIRENLMAEMLDYCLLESERNLKNAKIFQVPTNGKTARETAGKMARIIRNGGKGAGKEKTDYTNDLRNYLGLK